MKMEIIEVSLPKKIKNVEEQYVSEPVMTNPMNALVRTKNGVVEKIASLRDLVEKIDKQNQNIREICAHNFSQGIRLKEIGPYDPPFDYKLNQLNETIKELKDLISIAPEYKMLK